MHILLTNDDGLMAPGLQAAYAGLKARGYKVTACAPDSQRSASSQAVTLYRPIKAAPWQMPDGALGFAVYGTPADCARLGLTTLAREPVDLVVSGLNDDTNLGFDINYSGTVAAALEAAAAGCPALAASLERSEIMDWKLAVHVLVAVVDSMRTWKLPPGMAVNLNIPARLTTGRNDWFWTRTKAEPSPDYYDGEPHPDGSVLYHRLRPQEPAPDLEREPENDVEHSLRGHITLSPILPHSCHEAVLARLAAAGGK
ncbi:MAG: 5'/3'-nucleotidase SurE [Deltaproteobacteria bacterium]|nr:5'/3'-nucleotidase SurE [Deltaproteobacteria bacterium]